MSLKKILLSFGFVNIVVIMIAFFRYEITERDDLQYANFVNCKKSDDKNKETYSVKHLLEGINANFFFGFMIGLYLSRRKGIILDSFIYDTKIKNIIIRACLFGVFLLPGAIIFFMHIQLFMKLILIIFVSTLTGFCIGFIYPLLLFKFGIL